MGRVIASYQGDHIGPLPSPRRQMVPIGVVGSVRTLRKDTTVVPHDGADLIFGEVVAAQI